MATRPSIDQQIRLLHKASDQALKELDKLLASPEIKALSNEALKQALKLSAPSLVAEYGRVASVAACEWYMELRDAAGVAGGFRPLSARAIGTKAIQKGIEKLFENKGDKLENRIRAQVAQWVRQQAQETIVKNAFRDPAKPKFARVPKGKTCAWCTMLASRGFVYATPETAGELKKYHPDCDCMIVPAWGAKEPKIEGYDPDALYEMYRKARDAGGGVDAAVRRMRYMFPDMFTDSADPVGMLQKADAGWPTNKFLPVKKKILNHIIKRHGTEGSAISKTFAGKTRYEIAETIQRVANNYEVILPHPQYPEVFNAYTEIDGQIFVLGFKENPAGKEVTTCFSPESESDIMRAWKRWAKSN